MQKAFLFDMNGTMIDDMQYHIIAWHRILNDMGVLINMQQMKMECYGKNDELLERMQPGRFSADEKAAMSYEKEKQYQKKFKPNLQLLPGLADFFEKSKQHNIPMAIGTAAIMYNVDFVLDGLDLRSYFDAVVSAEDIRFSKPDPETFIKCAEHLNVPTEHCIVFEDSPKGVEAALNAGMEAVVITTMHEAHEFSHLNNILLFVKDYTDRQLEILF